MTSDALWMNALRDMVANDCLPPPQKGGIALQPRAISNFPGFPPPPGTNRPMMPPSSCSVRSRVSLREVASSVSGTSGLTLSESIRQSGKVFEEQEQRVKQLSQIVQVRSQDPACNRRVAFSIPYLFFRPPPPPGWVPFLFLKSPRCDQQDQAEQLKIKDKEIQSLHSAVQDRTAAKQKVLTSAGVRLGASDTDVFFLDAGG